MKFVQAKCPNCGGTLNVDPEKDAAICEFCKTPFVVEKAINNYNNSTVNNNVFNDATINIDTDNNFLKKYSFDQIIEMANKCLTTLKDYEKVGMYGEELIRRDYKSYQGYKFKAIGFYFHDNNPEKAFNYLIQAYDLADDSRSKTQSFNLNGEYKTFNFGTEKDECIRWMRQVLVAYPAIFKETYGTIFVPLMARGIELYANLIIKIENASANTISIDGFDINGFDGDEISTSLLIHPSYSHTICTQWKKEEAFGNLGVINDSSEIQLVYSYNKKLSKYVVYKIDGDNRIELNNGYGSGSNGCYIATCVYGSYNCPEVWALRRYRDYYLDERWWGRLFIQIYYAVSPKIVKLFGKTNWFNKINKSILNKKIKKLIEKGYENTPYDDKY